MTLEFTLNLLKPTEAICAIVKCDLSARRMLALLGTGFLCGPEYTILTAKHVIRNVDLTKHTLGVVLIDRNERVLFAPAVVTRESTFFDIAALKADLIIPPSPYLTVAELPINNNDDYVTVEYAESLFQLGKDAESDQIMFTPATRKGNITKAYVSTFPESTPTRSIEVSFPVLQGASGAPLMLNAPPWHVIGMITQNVQYEFRPAQVVTILDGEKYIEETRYYLPTGKAIHAVHLLQFINELTEGK